MARLPKEEEGRWRYRIKELSDGGSNHHQIAKMLEDEGYPGSTRPQNIKRIIDNLDKGAYSTGQLVSAEEQKAKLNETTARIEEDLENLDIIIEKLADKPQENSARLEKLYKLKNEFYKNLVQMWSISDSITGGKQVSTIKGDKVQINYSPMDYKKLHDSAKLAIREMGEARDG